LGVIWTIGHSNHSARRFIDLLRGAGIACVADVRSIPFSRRNPHFSQKPLTASLKDAGIEYWFLGEALGARPKEPACYEGGRASYARIAATPAFRQAIDALIDRAGAVNIALMCAEKEPLECHRTILVGRALAERGMELCHIHADGRIEPHAALEERLLRLAREQVDLLTDRPAALAHAYDRQARRMAYGAD
jgi:uncharacterized protein (DUF488 family)